jgi:glutamate/tyrosine decarboxylase-like PLP-dependent enzyme
MTQPSRLPPDVLERLRQRVEELAPFGSLAVDRVVLDDRAIGALGELAERLAPTYPYSEATYVGQMLKPPHPVAWTAYAATMLLNPNNHSLDGGPATSELEREAVATLGALVGLDRPLGHLTSSGTMANLEALWVAHRSRPNAVILSGANAHYTHARMCELLGARHESLPENELGQLDLAALEQRLAAGDIGTVVATVGTTSLGALDDVAAVAALCAEHGARLHVDAAYGGFYAILADGASPGVNAAPFSALHHADSVVLDPHKHGLQPYGCGCVLFADRSVAELYLHDSPYTYFTTSDPHPGEVTLECSRPGAAAAALWATLRAIPLDRGGLGDMLAATRRAALAFAERIEAEPTLALVVEPELDIVCFFPRRATAGEVTAAVDEGFTRLAAGGWHLAKLRLSSDWLRLRHPWLEADVDTTTVLRCCLLKPEHEVVVPSLVAAVLAATR